jgi:hypothetical protein
MRALVCRPSRHPGIPAETMLLECPPRVNKLSPAGKALAVGVAALATEAGLSWLRRRIGAEDRSSVPAVRGLGSASRSYLVSRRSLEEALLQTWEDPHGRVLARREVLSYFTTGPNR